MSCTVWTQWTFFSLFNPSRWYSCLAFDLTYGWREEVNFSCTCLNYWYFSADRDFNFDVSKVFWVLKIRLTCCWVAAVSGCCLLNSHGYWLPGTTCGDICGQELKIAKMSCLVLLLAIFAARGWKCSRWASWVHFWPYVRPGFENPQNELPGATFGRMCGQGLKMLKISFLGLLFAICAAIGWECWKSAAWGYFWPYVRPRAENAWSELPGLTFGYW